MKYSPCDGKQHLVEVTKVKLRDDAGAVSGIIGVAVDITDSMSGTGA